LEKEQISSRPITKILTWLRQRFAKFASNYNH